MEAKGFDIVMIGGSAGSIRIVADILASLPSPFSIPIVIIVHRMKNVVSEMDRLLSVGPARRKVEEPEDKVLIRSGHVYLAPQNYHLLIEANRTFSLDYSEPVHYSRPSIDVSFESGATIYKNKMLAILLSGANQDGAYGLGQVIAHGGTAIVQSPASAEYSIMPIAAIQKNNTAGIQTPEEIVRYLASLI